MTTATLIRPSARPVQSGLSAVYPPCPLSAQLDADRKTVAGCARDFVRIYCGLHRMPDEVQAAAVLSASELATNSTIHAHFPKGRRLIVVRCALVWPHLVLRVYDPDPRVPDTCGFDADALLADPDLDCSAHAGSSIVDASADYFEYHVTGCGKFAEAGFACPWRSRSCCANKYPNDSEGSA